MGKEELIGRAIDEVSHMNDRRFITYLAGICGVLYAATRPTVTLADDIKLWVILGIVSMTAITVIGLSWRPERQPVQPQSEPAKEA